MSEPPLKHVEEVFHQAVALDPPERGPFLDVACAGDPALRAAVETLLRYDDEPDPTDGFLVSPLSSLSGAEAPTLPAETTPTPTTLPLPAIPGYRVLKELGQGGMGVVYMAVQISLKRVVALKMLLTVTSASTQALVRFRSEAEALARLHDPHVVLIYDVGEFEGRPFISMEYVAGPNLARRLNGRAQDPHVSARLVETLARAVHHVHQAGMVHRDLKPANILLEPKESAPSKSRSERALSEYEPKISDFGLAKDFGVDRKLTQTGMTMGTPCYMAPEQATGEGPVGPPADIYALGAILYELLTGRPPFEGDSAIATIAQVIHDVPLSPLRLRPTLPRDLVTICLKCLEKAPRRRYASAADLADDLHRFQENESIQARPVGVVERGYRWCRRQPLVAGLIGLCAALFVAFVAAIILYERQLEAALQQQTVRADTEEQRAETEQRHIVDLHINIGVTEFTAGDNFGSLLHFAEALRLNNGEPVHERDLRDRIAALLQQCPPLLELATIGKRIHCAGLTPDGSRLVVADENGMLEVWDFSGEARRLATRQAERPPASLTLSHDGRLVAALAPDGAVHIWEVGSDRARPIPGARARSLKFHRDGKILLVQNAEGRIERWDLATLKPLEMPERTEGETCTAASPDGTWLLTIDGKKAGRVRDGSSGKPSAGRLNLAGPIRQAAVSADGRRVAVLTADGTLTVWDAVAARVLGQALAHLHDSERLLFSANGNSVVLTGRNRAAQVWHLDNAGLVADESVGAQAVDWVQFGMDGRCLLAADDKDRVRAWWTGSGRPATPVLGPGGATMFAGFGGRGERVLTVSPEGVVCVWGMVPAHPKAGFGAPLEQRPIGELLGLAQLLAGRCIGADEKEKPLPPEELRTSWQEMVRGGHIQPHAAP